MAETGRLQFASGPLTYYLGFPAVCNQIFTRGLKIRCGLGLYSVFRPMRPPWRVVTRFSGFDFRFDGLRLLRGWTRTTG
jgi:hypothetical protein